MLQSSGVAEPDILELNVTLESARIDTIRLESFSRDAFNPMDVRIADISRVDNDSLALFIEFVFDLLRLRITVFLFAVRCFNLILDDSLDGVLTWIACVNL